MKIKPIAVAALLFLAGNVSAQKFGGSPRQFLYDNSSPTVSGSWSFQSPTLFEDNVTVSGGSHPFRVGGGTFNVVNGRVGVFTDDPRAPFHLRFGGSALNFNASGIAIFQRSGSSGDGAMIGIISGSNGTAGIDFGDEGDIDRGGIFYNNANDSMFFRVNAQTAMDIASNKNVGIQTVACASCTLHVQGNIVATDAITIGSDTFTVNNVSYAWPPATTPEGLLKVDASGNLSWVITTVGNAATTNGVIVTSGTPTVLFGVNISSVEAVATGQYRVTFSTPYLSVFYNPMISYTDVLADNAVCRTSSSVPQALTHVDFTCENFTGTEIDVDRINIAVYGVLNP